MSVVEAKPTVPAGTWTIDPAHSSVEFSVRHMGFTTIRGRAGAFEGSLSGGDAPRLSGEVDVASVTTFDADRDTHLRSPDFFDVARYPRATFVSTSFETDGDELTVRGDFTLRGVTREIELRGTIDGPLSDPWGNERIGLALETVIDRRDFGVSWNAPLPGGGFLVSDEVRLLLTVSGIREG